ncbi:hypothetical protein CANARDRAFT_7856 [[Candida] arabinofermentans NRRL YB-2248]|uniref:Zn(2)-C6 fungal-type domain-containing protein n=1 Tax=[Candida] arabinofermentans NRRL YB-2248 TaxID=983967 RepID=A0A1E4T0E4_9ASCO|nr:hypothetical protein CANARDRAFT_7856 [[Candida] arabinofermentans NRRL YB-2248]
MSFFEEAFSTEELNKYSAAERSTDKYHIIRQPLTPVNLSRNSSYLSSHIERSINIPFWDISGVKFDSNKKYIQDLGHDTSYFTAPEEDDELIYKRVVSRDTSKKVISPEKLSLVVPRSHNHRSKISTIRCLSDSLNNAGLHLEPPTSQKSVFKRIYEDYEFFQGWPEKTGNTSHIDHREHDENSQNMRSNMHDFLNASDSNFLAQSSLAGTEDTISIDLAPLLGEQSEETPRTGTLSPIGVSHSPPQDKIPMKFARENKKTKKEIRLNLLSSKNKGQYELPQPLPKNKGQYDLPQPLPKKRGRKPGSTNKIKKDKAPKNYISKSSRTTRKQKGLTTYTDQNSESDEVEQKRVRNRAPRSKNGCWTCRLRRKRCPEQRPNCSECLRLGLVCDGYSTERPPFMRNSQESKDKMEEIKRITLAKKKRGTKLKYEEEIKINFTAPQSTSLIHNSETQGEKITPGVDLAITS